MTQTVLPYQPQFSDYRPPADIPDHDGQGQFHIHHKDARWFSSKGKFNFSYATMANARLFLLAMEKLTGYRFG